MKMTIGMIMNIRPADQLPHMELVDGDYPRHSGDKSDVISLLTFLMISLRNHCRHQCHRPPSQWRQFCSLQQCDRISQENSNINIIIITVIVQYD